MNRYKNGCLIFVMLLALKSEGIIPDKCMREAFTMLCSNSEFRN